MPRRRARRTAAPEVEARVARMRDHVTLESLDRPAGYRMFSPDGEIVYVGKAKRLRTRLLGYFRAAYPVEKSARVIREAARVEWEYQPSEFAAMLEELRAIKRWRPRLNVAMKRDAWHYAFVRVAPHPVPRFQVVRSAGRDASGVYYGPFSGAHQITEALRELNDALGLRDCRLDLPMFFADQTELPVASARTPGCIRHEIGKCLGPCIGAVTHGSYHGQFRAAVAFLEGAHDTPIAMLRDAMEASSDRPL
jgi:excinuclease ABC subunit C